MVACGSNEGNGGDSYDRYSYFCTDCCMGV